MTFDPCTQGHALDYCCQQRHDAPSEQIDWNGDAVYWIRPCDRGERPELQYLSLGFEARFESLEALDIMWDEYLRQAFPDR